MYKEHKKKNHHIWFKYKCSPSIKNRKYSFYWYLLFLHWISNQDKTYFTEENPINIPTKFSFNWPSGFREDWSVNVYEPWMQPGPA